MLIWTAIIETWMSVENLMKLVKGDTLEIYILAFKLTYNLLNNVDYTIVLTTLFNSIRYF